MGELIGTIRHTSKTTAHLSLTPYVTRNGSCIAFGVLAGFCNGTSQSLYLVTKSRCTISNSTESEASSATRWVVYQPCSLFISCYNRVKSTYDHKPVYPEQLPSIGAVAARIGDDEPKTDRFIEKVCRIGSKSLDEVPAVAELNLSLVWDWKW